MTTLNAEQINTTILAPNVAWTEEDLLSIQRSVNFRLTQVRQLKQFNIDTRRKKKQRVESSSEEEEESDSDDEEEESDSDDESSSEDDDDEESENDDEEEEFSDNTNNYKKKKKEKDVVTNVMQIECYQVIIASFLRGPTLLGLMRISSKAWFNAVNKATKNNFQGGFRITTRSFPVPNLEDRCSGGLIGCDNGKIYLIGPSKFARVRAGNRIVGYDNRVQQLDMSNGTVTRQYGARYNDFNDSGARMRVCAWANSETALAFSSTTETGHDTISSKCVFDKLFKMNINQNATEWESFDLQGLIPPPRDYSTSMFAVIGINLYMYGGAKIRSETNKTKSQYGDDMWMLNYTTNIWTEIVKDETSWPPALASPHFAVIGTDIVMSHGGGLKKTLKDRLSKDVWVFNTITSKWSKQITFGKGPVGKCTLNSEAVPIGDDIILYSGNKGSKKADGACVYALNVKTWTWFKIQLRGDLWARPFNEKVVALKDDEGQTKVYIVGGTSVNTNRDVRAEYFVDKIYELKVEKWRTKEFALPGNGK